MRASNQIINKMEYQPVSVAATNEEIVTILENKTERVITVTVRFLNGDAAEIGRRSYTIANDLYELLMGASPPFAPGKPVNEYRENDLWYIIDLMQS